MAANDCKTERITAAAVKCGTTVYTARSHGPAIRDAARAGEATPIGLSQQGFVTSTGRFVSRCEAWDIAVAAGQYVGDRAPLVRLALYSEDIEL